MRPDLFPVYDKMYERSEFFEELTGAGLRALSAQAVPKFKRYQYLSQVLVGPRVNWLNRLVINALERLPRRDGEESVIECRRV